MEFFNLDYLNVSQLLAFIDNHVLLKQCLVILTYAILATVSDLIIGRGLLRLANYSSLLDAGLIDCFHRPVYWTVFCVGILHALLYSNLPAPWQTTIPYLVQTLILFVWMMATLKIIGHLTSQDGIVERLARQKVSGDLFNLFRKTMRVVVVVIGLLWALSIWQVDLTPLFASAGIAGIAVALAVKDTLANFFGGISMFMDKTFKEGDYVVLDSGERGEVVEIGMRSTRMKTRDDILITVPNSILASTKIINESAPEPRFRIRIPVGVAYGSDIEKVEELLMQIALHNKEVVSEPTARVRMRGFGASSLDFELLCWVREPSLKGLVTHNILKEIYHTFERQSIVIPFPQMDVHLDKLD